MKKKTLQMFVSALLITAMSFSVVGCGDAGNEKEVSKESKTEEAQDNKTEVAEDSKEESKGWDEITEITIFGQNDNSSSIEWFDNYLKEEIGVTTISRTGGDDVLNTMLASGETADILQIQNVDVRENFIEAGLLLDLSQYKEQLPSIFENEVFANYIQYEMDTYGGVYGMSLHYGTRESYTSMSDIRIDLYKELGFPEIKDMDALLQVLADMQKLYPETPNGEKTYGLAMMPAWDGLYPETLLRLFFDQQGTWNVKNGLLIKSDATGEVEYPFADNGTLYNALKWFFKANQMGILDPDSPTLSYDEFAARSKAGRYMMNSYDNWFRDFSNLEENQAAGIGHATFYADCFNNTRSSGNKLGHTWTYNIGAETENLDAALRFLNWYYSYEGVEIMKNGPEGSAWEYDANGVRVMTEEYEAARKTDGDVDAIKYGENADMLAASGEGWNIFGDAQVNPATGVPVKLEYQYPMIADTPLNKTVQEVYGKNASYTGCFSFADYDALGFKSVELNRVLTYVASPADEITSQFNAIKKALNASFYKMIFAKDEAEFDALWKQTQADAEAGNYKEYHEAVKVELEKALEAKGKYFK